MPCRAGLAVSVVPSVKSHDFKICVQWHLQKVHHFCDRPGEVSNEIRIFALNKARCLQMLAIDRA